MRQVLASLALTLAVASCGTGALAQGTGGPQISGPGACVATKIELRIGTGGDDLRGGQNNLNVGIEFAGHNIPAESLQNVNRGANWPNNSVHTVVIPLTHPVPVGQIEAIRLYHIANGSFNPNGAVAGPAGVAAGIKTADNWDMSYIEAMAKGEGWGVRIANHGAYRFTGQNPDLLIRTSVNSVTAACPSVSSGGSGSGGSNFSQLGSGQGGSGSGTGSGSAEGGRPLTNSDVLRMVKDGVPQAAILGSIRSRRGAYDLSKKAKSEFFAAGGRSRASEITEVWDGMTNVMTAQETNGRGGEDASPPPAERLSSAAGSGSGNGQLLQRSGGGGGSASPSSGSANPNLQPLMPRNGSNTGSGSTSAKVLTNADVVNMLKAGVPEQAILASIQSNPAAFEVSTSARSEFFRELRKPPVGTTTPAWRKELENTWNAMAAKAAGGTVTAAATTGASAVNDGNKNADELSPQPYPPKSKSNSGAVKAQPGKQFIAPSNLKIFTVGEARNPEALKLLGSGSLLKASGGGNIGPAKTMSATGNSPGPTASTVARTAPNGPTSVPPSGSSNQRGMLSASATALCLNKTSIGAVNGQSRYVQFTPGGHYVITGCGFGSAPGKIYLSGGFHGFPQQPGQIQLAPYVPFGAKPGWSGRWSDREIDAELDPSLSGELDQDTVTLVVETSTGQQAQVTDFSFHAQRIEFMLPSIPDSAVPNPPAGSGHGWCGAWLKNCTVEVLRDYTHATPTPDYYTVKLKEGFVLSRVVLLVGRPEGGVGTWTTPNINGNQIVVNWAWNTDPATNFTNSLYGLEIFVVGPAGVTNAWTGQ